MNEAPMGSKEKASGKKATSVPPRSAERLALTRSSLPRSRSRPAGRLGACYVDMYLSRTIDWWFCFARSERGSLNLSDRCLIASLAIGGQSVGKTTRSIPSAPLLGWVRSLVIVSQCLRCPRHSATRDDKPSRTNKSIQPGRRRRVEQAPPAFTSSKPPTSSFVRKERQPGGRRTPRTSDCTSELGQQTMTSGIGGR